MYVIRAGRGWMYLDPGPPPGLSDSDSTRTPVNLQPHPASKNTIQMIRAYNPIVARLTQRWHASPGMCQICGQSPQKTYRATGRVAARVAMPVFVYRLVPLIPRQYEMLAKRCLKSGPTSATLARPWNSAFSTCLLFCWMRRLPSSCAGYSGVRWQYAQSSGGWPSCLHILQ